MAHELITAALVILHLFMWWTLLQDEGNRERFFNTILSMLFFAFEKAGDAILWVFRLGWGAVLSSLSKLFTKRVK